MFASADAIVPALERTWVKLYDLSRNPILSGFA
jgi:hypothetical protein